MLQGISNTIASLPVASIACTATGLYIGRKWCAAAAYKAGSLGANLIASSKAEEWNQASAEYLKIAKNDGIRDFAAAAGLIAIGLASGRAQEKVVTKEETGYFQDYGMPMIGSIGGSIGWMLKKYQVLGALENSITPGYGKTKSQFDMTSFKAKI